MTYAKTISTSITDINKLQINSSSQVTDFYNRVSASFTRLGDRLEQIGARQNDLVGTLDPLISYSETLKVISNTLSNSIEELRKSQINTEQDKSRFLNAAGQIIQALQKLDTNQNTLTDGIEQMNKLSTRLGSLIHAIPTTKNNQQSNSVLNYGIWAMVISNGLILLAILYQLLFK